MSLTKILAIMNIGISRKSQEINEEEWMNRVEELYNERQTLFPLEPKQLRRLFDLDLCIEEALLKDLTKGHMHAFMELHVKHELGEYKTTFRADNDAKEFSRNFLKLGKN